MRMIALFMTSRVPGTLPNNLEINPKEYTKTITTRSGVQLSEIHVKRPIVNRQHNQLLRRVRIHHGLRK